MIARFAPLAIAAVVACTTTSPIGSASGVLFGAAVIGSGSTDDATQEAAYASAESDTGRHFDLDRIYRQWDEPVPAAREQWTIAAGRTPIISFKTTLAWADLAAGAGDPTLDAIAKGYAGLQVPVFAIFDQDPENSPTLGSPADYAAAYRHVVTEFRADGVTNVVWIWNLKSPSFAELADAYYPGDDVVDWIGTSAYNFGINDAGGRWISFADLIADFVTWATPHDKPLIVSEWASDEDDAIAGRKASWIEDAQATIHATPAIRAMSAFWSDLDETSFDSKPSSLQAFSAFAADPYTHLRD